MGSRHLGNDGTRSSLTVHSGSDERGLLLVVLLRVILIKDFGV